MKNVLIFVFYCIAYFSIGCAKCMSQPIFSKTVNGSIFTIITNYYKPSETTNISCYIDDQGKMRTNTFVGVYGRTEYVGLINKPNGNSNLVWRLSISDMFLTMGGGFEARDVTWDVSGRCAVLYMNGKALHCAVVTNDIQRTAKDYAINIRPSGNNGNQKVLPMPYVAKFKKTDDSGKICIEVFVKEELYAEVIYEEKSWKATWK